MSEQLEKSQFPKRPFALQPLEFLAGFNNACSCRNSLNGLSLFNVSVNIDDRITALESRNSLNGLSLFNRLGHHRRLHRGSEVAIP